MFRIRFQPAEHEITCGPDETLLAAALRVGLRVPHGCKNGGCGACKMRLVAGQVDDRGDSLALSSDERAAGWVLACVSQARSDCTLDTEP